jgi:hypothetical protein
VVVSDRDLLVRVTAAEFFVASDVLSTLPRPTSVFVIPVGVLMTGEVNVLFVRVSVVALPTNVSVDVGSVKVPVLLIVDMIGAVRVLLVNVSVVARPTIVSVLVGSVSVPVFTIDAITGAVSVLLVRVSVVALPTKVSVASGKVIVLLAVCELNIVVDVAVVPAASNLICFVASVTSTMAVVESDKDLLVNVAVALFFVASLVLSTFPNPTSVLVIPVGVFITGEVSVLLVSV